uniref:Uncharacterized protein n=1 Tax=Lepeophtheirus salmonis TaxID=72036 RepID=A0A0K2TAW6_LEPSM
MGNAVSHSKLLQFLIVRVINSPLVRSHFFIEMSGFCGINK